jgi:hypothetical protein
MRNDHTPTLLLPIAVVFGAALFSTPAQAWENRIQAFDPTECPASRCTLTEASYPFGQWTVRVIHAEANPEVSTENLPDDQRWGCKAWLELRDSRNRLKRRLFGDLADPVGGPGGLYVPSQQPIPGLFLVAMYGDYSEAVFAIHADGSVDSIWSGIQIYDQEHRLLFLADSPEGPSSEVTILDLAGHHVVFKDPEIFASYWYRLGKEIFFLGGKSDGTLDKSVGYFFDFSRRKFERRLLKPEVLAKANEIPGVFDFDRLRVCHSPTTAYR